MKEKKTILKLYEDYTKSVPKVTKKYLETSNQFVENIEKLNDKLNKKEKKELEKVIDLILKMNDEYNKEMFIYAYSLGVKLTTEVFYKGKEK